MLKFYARLNEDDYIDGYSDIETEEFNIPFEIEKESKNYNDLSACSGNCFKIEDGIAVKKKDVALYLSEWETKRQNNERVKLLKNMLAETDYKAIKFAEGLIPSAEYETIRQERQAWREEINILEDEN